MGERGFFNLSESEEPCFAKKRIIQATLTVFSKYRVKKREREEDSCGGRACQTIHVGHNV